MSFFNEEVDLVKNNQDNEFTDNKLSNLDSITVNKNPNSNKKYIDDELDKNTILRFIQTLENYIKVSVGNDIYNLTKYKKLQITDTTIIKSTITGYYLPQN